MNKPFGECIWILETQSSHQLVRFVLSTMFDSLKLIMAYLGDINWWNFTGNQLLEFSVDLFFPMIFSYVYSIKLPLIWKKK